MNILFVCTGNTCRSPMAEGLCKKLYKDRINICSSAGIFTRGGDVVSENAVSVCKEAGVDISGHFSSPLPDLSVYDKIIVMTKSHAQMLIDVLPQLESKIYIPSVDIPDPFGQSLDVYRQCRDSIINMLNEFFESNSL